MAVWTTETTVTFRHPFTLASPDGPQPPGTYRLVIDEDEVPGRSFLAFRRTATMLRIPAFSISGRPNQVFPVNSVELVAAFEADGRG